MSNPRPKTFQKELLRAQTVIAARGPFPLPAGKPSRPAGQVASSCMVRAKLSARTFATQ